MQKSGALLAEEHEKDALHEQLAIEGQVSCGRSRRRRL